MCGVLREAGEGEREVEDRERGESVNYCHRTGCGALDFRNLWFELIPYYKTKSDLCFEQAQGSPYPSGYTAEPRS